MSDQLNNPGGRRLCYNFKVHKKVQFGILHDIGENVTLVQLMGSVENVNHSVSIVGYCIF